MSKNIILVRKGCWLNETLYENGWLVDEWAEDRMKDNWLYE
jgi:hypothetical protein